MKSKSLRLDEVAKFLIETMKPLGVSVTLKGVGSRLNIYVNGGHTFYIDLKCEELKNISNLRQICRLAKRAERDYECGGVRKGSDDYHKLWKMQHFVESYGGVGDLTTMCKNINLTEKQHEQLFKFLLKTKERVQL